MSFFCKSCGYESVKWAGQCPGCGDWNTFKEVTVSVKKNKNKSSVLKLKETPPLKLKDISFENKERILTGMVEFDNVLGGGIIPGMVLLTGGEPGIGKSTLLLQISQIVSSKISVLYVSGEESLQQIKIRAERINAHSDNIIFLNTNSAERVIAVCDQIKPDFVVVDSIQSMSVQYLDSPPGSMNQMKESASIFTSHAKSTQTPFFLIGHITKDGYVAGPKMIEHLVDTVLYFEGDPSLQHKILRSVKNRFGSTDEIAVFEMTGNGLQQVLNPSGLFVENRAESTGSAVGCFVSGTRAFLVEIQALVTKSVYGTAQRVSVGYDPKRLAMLLAVAEKYLDADLRQFDIFLNVTGGFKSKDTSLDLAVLAAIISGYEDRPVKALSATAGEVGLNGCIRRVSHLEKRIKEAEKMGFKHLFCKNKSKNSIVNDVSAIKDFYRQIF
ncbi:MAG: DNA repair protein RadA [Candidatus Cloacimonadota bacterium]|nr:MAG: DNA repair protein RadA [Candidatus Cloacimonadota bacterium]